MGRRSDPDRLWRAQLEGTTTAIDDEIRRNPGLEARHRAEWPELWRRIDRLLALVDSTGWSDGLRPR